jgi:hypothetical protein
MVYEMISALLREPNIRKRSDDSTSFDDTTGEVGAPGYLGGRSEPSRVLCFTSGSTAYPLRLMLPSPTGGETLQPIVGGREPVQGR